MVIALRLKQKSRQAHIDIQKLKQSLFGTEDRDILILNSTELAGLEFNVLHTDGTFHELIGNPSLPFSIMIYGLPGSGKSTLTIQLAKYLATRGMRVLYYAKEESTRTGFSYTLKEKLDRLQAYHENLFFATELPDNLSNYDVLVIDSVNDAQLSVEQLERLQNQNPHLSMLLIFQSTKDGHFRGEQTWQHLVDTVIKVDSGTAATGKNRFGQTGTVEIFNNLAYLSGGNEEWWGNIKFGITRKKLIQLLKKHGWTINTKQGKGSHIKASKGSTVLTIPQKLKKGIISQLKNKIKNEEKTD